MHESEIGASINFVLPRMELRYMRECSRACYTEVLPASNVLKFKACYIQVYGLCLLNGELRCNDSESV
jgi:hypothetical protein